MPGSLVGDVAIDPGALMSSRQNAPLRLFGLGSWAETTRIADVLRRETVGGGLLVLAASLALVLANSPASPAYLALRDVRIGPAALHLDLSVGAWAADGLLALFFFLVGLELKREFVAGDLRDPRRALVPILAAAGGVVVPAAIFSAVNLTQPELLRGWAIPTATDIAFAVAVLAVIGSHLPAALRTFLLTLAVVDDLIAITIIAVFYTADVHPAPLAAALLPLAAFAILTHTLPRLFAERPAAAGLLLLPLGVTAWALVHASGIHATVAGVALGLTVPVRRRDGRTDLPGLAEILEHRLRPLSSGVAVPVFAFFSAGVAIGGPQGLVTALSDPVALGIVAGLVLGKPIGILLSTWALTKATRAELDPTVAWVDLVGVGLLAGIGFTVSLLVGELSFGVGTTTGDHTKVGILAASLTAAALASVVLTLRNRRYRAIAADLALDSDGDGTPDRYESD